MEANEHNKLSCGRAFVHDVTLMQKINCYVWIAELVNFVYGSVYSFDAHFIDVSTCLRVSTCAHKNADVTLRIQFLIIIHIVGEAN